MMFDDYYWKLRGCKGRAPWRAFGTNSVRAPR
jgi:hypothetical protein